MIAHLELLVGREVVDANGEHAGRIEEAHAEADGTITEFVLARGNRPHRVSVADLFAYVLHWAGAQKRGGSVHVPWDKLDLSDVHRPRLTCPVRDLLRETRG